MQRIPPQVAEHARFTIGAELWERCHGDCGRIKPLQSRAEDGHIHHALRYSEIANRIALHRFANAAEIAGVIAAEVDRNPGEEAGDPTQLPSTDSTPQEFVTAVPE